MNIRIYQVNMKRDTNNVAFMRYELLEKLQGSQAVNAKIYDKVFDGEVDCQTLEDVYQMFNLNHPESSAEVDGKSDKGISKSAEEKPSVREKLERYKAQAKTEKEADRTDLDKAGEKTQSQTRTNQTTHQQPKKKKNRNKNKAR